MILKLGLLIFLVEMTSSLTTTPSNVSLVEGPNPHSGNVMVDGLPVCDDNWDDADGVVVCRQLGYIGLEQVTTGSTFGTVYNDFAMDGVECSGFEDRLDDCPFYQAGDFCGINTGAGVICVPGLIPFS